MSKPHRKRANGSQAISQKKNSGITRKTSSLQKSTSKSKRKRILLRRESPRGQVQKTPFISMVSLALIVGSILLVGLGGVLVWDYSANNKHLLSYVVNVQSNQEPQKTTYAPLPINKTKAPGPVPKDMAWIPGGWFWMGTDDESHFFANPIHKVYVDGYWMGKYEVTNKEWAEFARETKVLTVAEKKPDPNQFPPDKREVARNSPPFSLVFTPPAFPLRNLRNHSLWWKNVPYADWKAPEGKKSSIKNKDNHPVVQICWDDAQAFLKWKNEKLKPKKGWEYRLPTEAEWEFAARGGKHMWKFIWGKELTSKEKWPGSVHLISQALAANPNSPTGGPMACMAPIIVASRVANSETLTLEKWHGNIWQGRFPNSNTEEDGYILTAPVGSYPPNAFGLYDMAGNVWEWCHDFYREDYYKNSPQKNPTGPFIGFDPLEPGMAKRVQRGGSFLCDASYCERYLTYARGKGEVTSAANHVGFRYVLARKISGN